MLYIGRWKALSIVFISLLGILFTLPNFFSESTLQSLPDWVPKKQIVLGLDLQGGSHLLLELDRKAVVTARVNTLRDDVRSALRDAKINYSGGVQVVGNAVKVEITNPEQVAEARTRLQELAPTAGNFLTGVARQDVTIEETGGNTFTLGLTQAGIDARISDTLEQSLEIVRRRIDELGTREPTIHRQGSDRIVVQVPGLQDPEELKAVLGQTARLTFRLVQRVLPAEEARNLPPQANAVVLYSEPDPTTGEPAMGYVLNDRVLVGGEDLVDASPGFDSRTNEPVVNFRFNTHGAQQFGDVTSRNVDRLFAIILDDKVISAPRILQPITGGAGQISGNFTPQSANELAVLLRAGALPAPLTVVEERTVGPGLGQDSIDAGRQAAIVGTALVIGCLVAVYGLLGLFANLAMLINVSFTFAILSLLGATLTLPGIAGIALSVGMSVDANVLIFERIREEQRQGRSAITAIDTGFTKAIGTITDANLTLLIASIVLYVLGTGPIRGFAVTLAIGNLTSFFTAVTVTRLIVATWVRWARPRRVPI